MKKLIKEFTAGFKEFGENISVIVNSVLLSVVYFLGVGTTSIIGKISGKDFLDNGFDNETYWEDLNLKKSDNEVYYRMF